MAPGPAGPVTPRSVWDVLAFLGIFFVGMLIVFLMELYFNRRGQ